MCNIKFLQQWKKYFFYFEEKELMGRKSLIESCSLVLRKGLVAKAFPGEEQEVKSIHFVSLLSAVASGI